MFLIIGKIAIVKPFAESHQHSRKRGKGMEKQEKNTVTPYDLDGRPPLKLAIPLGLQHVLAMFVGNLTPLLIITAACGIEAGGELQVALLQNAMLIAGIVTLVQVFTIGPVGGKLPIVMGTSSGFIGVCQSVAGVMGNGVVAYGAIMAASFIGGNVHISVGEEKIHQMMQDYDGVIIWDLHSTERNRYLKYCFAHSVRCYVSPKISDIILMGSERIHLFDTPLLVSRNMGLAVDQRAAKRVMDILISGIGIIITSPIMLIIAIAVKAYDRGPVFYFQDRLTLGGKPFKICKFRSMCVDSEKNGARLASKHDSRITPVGHVLRNLHLDELPQLFNVFKGDMSLVGPRPERESIMLEYEKELPEFYYRLKVKAGLTGYAQVYGKYNTTPYDKLKLDLFYIENYSFLLDIKLIFMTVKIFFQKEVSEGVDDRQVNALKDSGKNVGVSENKTEE